MRAPLRVVAWMLLLLMGLTRARCGTACRGRREPRPADPHCQGATRRQGERRSSGSTIARCHSTCAARNRGRTNAATAQARGATNDYGTRARALSSSGPSMIIRSYLVTLWAVLFVGCGPTVAQSIAVFDFELIDTSLEGAIRGARPDEQERLAHLSDQLRQLLRDSGRFSLVDITPIAREAQEATSSAAARHAANTGFLAWWRTAKNGPGLHWGYSAAGASGARLARPGWQGRSPRPLFTCHPIRVFCITGRNGKTRRSTSCPPPHRHGPQCPGQAPQVTHRHVGLQR